ATHFLGTENSGQFPRRLGKRQIIKMHVTAFEHLLEEQTQRRHSHLHCAGREFPFLYQVPLEPLTLRVPQLVRPRTEILPARLDREEVAADCGWGKVAAVEVLHHPLSAVGRGSRL